MDIPIEDDDAGVEKSPKNEKPPENERIHHFKVTNMDLSTSVDMHMSTFKELGIMTSLILI